MAGVYTRLEAVATAERVREIENDEYPAQETICLRIPPATMDTSSTTFDAELTAASSKVAERLFAIGLRNGSHGS